MLQARHVRPSLAKIGELNVSRRGIFACSLALALLASLPLDLVRQGGISTFVLYAAAACLAYTSATVVTGLTAAAASCCDSDEGGAADLQRGRAMGSFRSKVSGLYPNIDIDPRLMIRDNLVELSDRSLLLRLIG